MPEVQQTHNDFDISARNGFGFGASANRVINLTPYAPERIEHRLYKGAQG